MSTVQEKESGMGEAGRLRSVSPVVPKVKGVIDGGDEAASSAPRNERPTTT